MLIVADTSPINYLILLQVEEVLPALYRQILIPSQVLEELTRKASPAQVRHWAASPPTWVEVRTPSSIEPSLMAKLDVGEAAAISLAREVHADSLLIHDWDGREVANAFGFTRGRHIGGVARRWPRWTSRPTKCNQ